MSRSRRVGSYRKLQSESEIRKNRGILRKLAISFFILLFLSGLTMLLYPSISKQFNADEHTQSVRHFITAVEGMDGRASSEMMQAAHEFNESLLRNPNRLVMTEAEIAEYKNLLNPTGLGIIGVLEIEILNINLPIYHGTDESVLQAGLGHLEGSSLPVGGPGTHAVITGHRGLPSSTLLSNLDSLVIGDTFSVRIPGDTLVYRVDRIVIVEPHETAELVIYRDADYCTLVTCTPYGVNTHRMLVRGIRVTDEEAEFIRSAVIPAGALVLPGALSAMIVMIPVTLTISVALFIRLRRIFARGE